jgi:hypothetical protein
VQEFMQMHLKISLFSAAIFLDKEQDARDEIIFRTF